MKRFNTHKHASSNITSTMNTTTTLNNDPRFMLFEFDYKDIEIIRIKKFLFIATSNIHLPTQIMLKVFRVETKYVVANTLVFESFDVVNPTTIRR